MSRRNRRGRSKVRRQIAVQAAKLMYERSEREYYTAKRKAARMFGVDERHPSDLPSNQEIREEIMNVAILMEGDQRFQKLKDMRIYALWFMNQTQRFFPKVIGSTLTGHIRKGSDIDIHLFSDSLALVTSRLDDLGIFYDVERKRVVKFNQERIFNHIHVHGKYEIEVTVYDSSYANYPFKCSITGKLMNNATVHEFEQVICAEHGDIELEEELQECEDSEECYEMFKVLLLPLESVQGSKKHHPEGDTLYHSLQVFELAREEGYSYDIEFLQAALLHDVGKGIDRHYHAEAGADAIEGFVSERVTFLVRYHMDALLLQQGKIGHRKRLYLQRSEYFDDLMALRDFDNRGRVRGAIVDTVDEVIDYLKNLEAELA